MFGPEVKCVDTLREDSNAGDRSHGAERVRQSRRVPRHHVSLRKLGAKYVGDRQDEFSGPQTVDRKHESVYGLYRFATREDSKDGAGDPLGRRVVVKNT